MGNCLVTKLSESVQNANIPYLGEFKINLVKYATTVDDVYIACSSGVSWESTVNLYGDSSKAENYGKSGNFTGLKHFFFEEDGELIIHPMYSMTMLTLHGTALADLSTIYTNTGTLELRNGGGYAERGSDIRTNINITRLDEFYKQADVPIIFDGDYSKITFDASITRLIINAGSRLLNKILTIGKALDLSVFGNIPNKELVDGDFINLTYQEARTIKDLVRISNIEALSGFVNVTTFSTHGIPIESGSVVTAFSGMTKLTYFLIVGNKTVEDLADLFNAWKAAGRRNSSCLFYYDTIKYKVTGYPSLGTGDHTVTFDANGNWTVV